MKPGALLDRFRALFSEADDPSHDAIRQAISDALGELVKAKPGMPEQYAWVNDVYDDHVIFTADLDGDGDRDLYSVEYTIGADGECDFTSTPKQVKRITTYEDVTDDEDAGESRRLSEVDYGDDERKEMAKAGQALPDGSYPIKTKADLSNAIQAIGRGKNNPKAEIKAHIVKRANALGATDALPADWEGSTSKESLAEIEIGELTLLSEQAIKADGSALMKIIRPGWGSSGYYGKAMLERDGPKVFAKGTKMYLDHPTKTEDRELPERSVTRLAATLSGDATYLDEQHAPKAKDGTSLGEGLYAPAAVISTKRELLEDLAPHIGVSIRAAGRTSPKPVTIDGRTGPQIESLVAARSVDFVTEPGAGGQIVSLFESARDGEPYHRSTPAPTAAAVAAGKETTVAETTKLTEIEELRREVNELREADRKRSTRESEAAILGEARTMAENEIARVRLPGFVRARIVAEVCADPATKDGELDRAAFKTQIAEAAKAEAEYFARASGRGSIKGLGVSATETPRTDEQQNADASKSLTESFRQLGLTEKQAADAVAVRN